MGSNRRPFGRNAARYVRAGLTLLAVAAWSPTLAQTAPPAVPCVATFASPLVVPIAGQFGDIVIDDKCERAYVTNRTGNRVEVISLRTGTLGTPIQVGAVPAGLDISPDGNTLYVANSGASNVSVVDLVRGVELRKVTVPQTTFSNDTPFSIATAGNGAVLFSTTFAGSGFGARMMQLNPMTDEVTHRRDFWFFGSTTEATFLKASPDRSVIGIVAGDISSGPVFKYFAATDAFSPEKNLNTFIAHIAFDRTASVALVNQGTSVLDGNLNLAATIAGGTLGVAVDPAGKIGYRATSNSIEILDLASFTVTGSLDAGDTITGNILGFGPGVGRMGISRDGSVLAVITDTGVSLVKAGVVNVVPMATLGASMRLTAGQTVTPDSLVARATFALGTESNGIDPISETVSVQFGSVGLAIPAGSFVGGGGLFSFSGTVDGSVLIASLRFLGGRSWRLDLTASNVDFTGTAYPIAATLRIGDDQGETTLPVGTAVFRSQ